jgi:hypothetical protein
MKEVRLGNGALPKAPPCAIDSTLIHKAMLFNKIQKSKLLTSNTPKGLTYQRLQPS